MNKHSPVKMMNFNVRKIKEKKKEKTATDKKSVKYIEDQESEEYKEQQSQLNSLFLKKETWHLKKEAEDKSEI